MSLNELAKLPIGGLLISGARHCLFPENEADFKVGLAQTATAVISIIQSGEFRGLINDLTRVDTSSCILSGIITYEAARKAFRDGIYDFYLIGSSSVLPIVGCFLHARQYGREFPLIRIPVGFLKISLLNSCIAFLSEGMNLAWRWGVNRIESF